MGVASMGQSKATAAWRRLLPVALGVVILLATVAACKPDEDTVTGEPESSTASQPAEPTGEWVNTLPTEPGTSWDIARYYTGDGTIPVQLTVAGPWAFEVTGDGWTSVTEQIAEPADVPDLDQFADITYVLKGAEGTTTAYYVRRITDEWMLQLGKITDDGTNVTAEPYEQPLQLWPVDIEVGDSFPVGEGQSFSTVATVLARNSVTTPAGTMDDAYLVRFEYTAIAEGAPSGTQYYVLSPDVGVVAVFSVAAGVETAGFTALDMANVMTRLPGK
ncbi:MAG: hypothetical protein EG823_04275 [Actinobacteria bacterium]|nr:hypothetical protein [Actinomycetota bacterium]